MIVLEKSPSSLICASQLAPVGDRGTEQGRSRAAADSALQYDGLQQRAGKLLVQNISY